MKKIKFFIVFLTIILIPSVYAIDDATNQSINTNSTGNATTYKRDSSKNYGVNKKWNITDKNLSNVLRTPLVDSSQKIYDFVGILTEEEKSNLKEKIDQFIKKYNTEIVIVTYNLPYTNDSVNEDFAADFYDYNDFGLEYKNYNGILLFRNTYEYDPYYNIYTFGDAQLYFSHRDYDYILDDIYYDLKLKNYFTGFSKFIDDINSRYLGGISPELEKYVIDENGFLKKLFYPAYPIITIISLIITISVTVHYVKKNKMIKKAVEASEYLDKKSVVYSVKEDKFLHKHLSSYTNYSSSSSGGGGYSSSSGSSGGGHSSGVGRHG